MTVLDRFLKYVSFDTRSDENSESFPSTAKQLVLGKELAKELEEIGLINVGLDENGYVYGFLPASPDR
ncbi:MAG: peptidase T, partial [Acutalibacteraceae bacterium]|nr:peptidase T [Acutalibacteraceae bacterium]